MTNLKRKQRYSPDVHVTDEGVVEKTYRDKILPLRILGAVFIWWESFIYSRIDGIKGIPKFLGNPDMYTLRLSFMGGENLRDTARKPDEAYFSGLDEILRNTHKRSIVHLDLRNRRNYGIDPEGKPYLIDFSPSLYLPFGINSALTWIDRMGVLKIKSKTAPELLTEREMRLLVLGNLISRIWFPKRIFNLVKSSCRRFRVSSVR